MDFNEVLAVLTGKLYNLALWVGTAWLIWNGWSPWWVLVPIGFTVTIKTGKAAEKAQ